MKYYLIYLKSGMVVDICSFDDEESRDNQHAKWVYRDAELFQVMCSDYDDVQCLNVV